MIQTTVKVSGMTCSMCEAHISGIVAPHSQWKVSLIPFKGRR